MANNNPIGIIDSGIGGMTVLNSIRKKLPYENYIYLADYSFAPYGSKTSTQIFWRTVSLVQKLLDYNCKMIVIACNTATLVAIDNLRQMYKTVEFIGVEPAINSAIKKGCKKIVVMTTPLTQKQDRFKELLKKCNINDSKIICMHTPNLATDIENNFLKYKTVQKDLKNKIDDIITQFDVDIDAVVLGCTHYVYIKKYIIQYIKNKNMNTEVFDGNKGVANRLFCIMDDKSLFCNKQNFGSVAYLYL